MLVGCSWQDPLSLRTRDLKEKERASDTFQVLRRSCFSDGTSLAEDQREGNSVAKKGFGKSQRGGCPPSQLSTVLVVNRILRLVHGAFILKET